MMAGNARLKYRALSFRRGATAIEFAFTLPLLITIVLGCIDFGRFAYDYIAVTNAARVGAGLGTCHPFTPTTQPVWEAAIRDAVRAELGSAEPLETVTIAVLTEGDVRRVQVVVSRPFTTLIDWPGVPHEVELGRSVEMRFIR